MKSKKITGLFLLLSASLFSQTTIKIPDVAFEEALIDLKYDTNGLTGDILTSDANYIVNLNIYDPKNNKKLRNVSQKIEDLTGIEHFKNLKRLDCYGNNIKTLDVSKNSELNFLNLSGNKLTSLDVSKNSKLTFLACDTNQLTSLILGNLNKLSEIYANVNKLTQLDVSNCNSLNSLDISSNPIKEVKVNSTVLNSIPEGWFKDKQTNYVSEFGNNTTVQTSSSSKINTTSTPVIKEKTYDENFKQQVVLDFEKLVLETEYLEQKKAEIRTKYNLNEQELNNWLSKHSKLLKLIKTP